MVDDVLTIEEAAELLKLHDQTIYRKVRSGEIPAARIGRRWRISRDVIERMLRGESMTKDDRPGGA